jgi:hypothetical protein
MNKSIDLKILVVFVIMLSQLQTQTLSVSFAELEPLWTNPVCDALSFNQLRFCSNRFEKEIQNFKQSNDVYNRRGICCAINHLKDCIIDAIGDKCGSNQKESMDAIIAPFVSVFKLMEFSDRCDDYPYGSPLCYSNLILALIGFALIVLLLFSIYLTVKLCCCCCRLSKQRYKRSKYYLNSCQRHNL